MGDWQRGRSGRGEHQRRYALRPLRHRVPGAVRASACSTAAAIMEGYEVLEKLGSGSFGTIRRVIRKSDKKVLLLLLTVHASVQARGAKAPGALAFFRWPRFAWAAPAALPACVRPLWCRSTSSLRQHAWRLRPSCTKSPPRSATCPLITFPFPRGEPRLDSRR